MNLLRSVQNLKLNIKLNSIILSIFVIMLTLVLVVVKTSIERAVIEIGRQRLEQETQLIETHFQETEAQVLTAGYLLARSTALIEAAAQQDTVSVRRILTIDTAPFDLDKVDVVNASGELLVTLGSEPAEFDDEGEARLFSLGLIGADATGLTFNQDETKDTQSLFLSAVVPLKNSTGVIVGALLVAREMNEGFLDRLDFARADIHLALIHEGGIVATDLSRPERFMLAGEEIAQPVQQALAGEIWISDGLEMGEGNTSDLAAYMPLTLTGQTEAVLSIRSEFGSLFALQNQLTGAMTPVLVALSGFAIFLITVLIRRTVTVPLARLQQVAVKMSEGDYSIRAKATTGDEIGQLGRAFNDMADAVAHRDTELKDAAATLEKRVEERTEQLQVARDEALAASRIANENSRLKSEFLSTMSHELRTPLNAIEGFTSIMLSGMGVELTPKAKGMVERVSANSKRLLGLINDFLDLTRIESGRMELVNAPVSPKKLLTRWATQMSVLAEQKHIAFEVDIDPQLPDELYGDEEALTKIAVNLLGNAFKFTQEGRVALSLKYLGDMWSIEVRDTGIGIPPHARQYIFEEFRQVDGSSRRQYGGTGLGLAIVQKLTRAMGGTVTLMSEVGEGSTFTVMLPVHQSLQVA